MRSSWLLRSSLCVSTSAEGCDHWETAYDHVVVRRTKVHQPPTVCIQHPGAVLIHHMMPMSDGIVYPNVRVHVSVNDR
ncbi:unnamed protein product [Soboliphyme baturini]|uniref:Secreted protein n=1 Tax=Soboliphyme baturini TaxID=241478 RepID=A0A183IZA0_9BILA|nr:unnamed protein product [Soboliphyme baturini]